MTETDCPWPDYIYISFSSSIAQDANDGIGVEDNTFFGPMMRLFYTLFSPDEGPYDVKPQFRPSRSREHVKVPTVMVEVNRHPVFFLEIKPPASLLDESKRQEADKQMRQKFKDLGPILDIPALYGVCVFGTRLAFYEYDRATCDIQPTEVTQPASEVAPIERWDSDIFEKEGADRLKFIVERVKDMCTVSEE